MEDDALLSRASSAEGLEPHSRRFGSAVDSAEGRAQLPSRRTRHVLLGACACLGVALVLFAVAASPGRGASRSSFDAAGGSARTAAESASSIPRFGPVPEPTAAPQAVASESGASAGPTTMPTAASATAAPTTPLAPPPLNPTQRPTSAAPTARPTVEPTSPPQVLLVVSNEYGVNGRVHDAPYLYPWHHVAEPYRATLLEASAPNVSAPNKTFSWTLTEVNATDNGHHGAPVVLRGAKVSHVFVAAGRVVSVAVAVTAGGDGAPLASGAFVLNVKYVRRELRSLVEADRRAFMRALATIYHAKDEGAAKALWGDRFVAVPQMMRQHLAAVTATAGCSPIHGVSASFLTGHSAFMLEIELAMQAVEPRAALPYWDYTIDAVRCGGDLGCVQKGSALFTEHFLGSSASANATLPHEVADGAFAGVPIARVGHGASQSNDSQTLWPEHNAYGLLTDSYNWNPAPRLQRAMGEWCGSDPTTIGNEMQWLTQPCTVISGALGQTTLLAYADFVDAEVHGGSTSVHIAFGGATQCAATFDDLKSANESYAADVSDMLGANLGFVWLALAAADELVYPEPGACQAADMGGGDARACQPYAKAVAGLDLDALSQAEIWGVVNTTLLAAAVFPSEFGISADLSQPVLLVIAKLFGYVGAITPFGTPYASSNDPLFFPLHNVYIRLWAQQVLTLGSEFNATWSDGPQVECVGHNAGHPVMDFDMPIGPHLPSGAYDADQICSQFPDDALCARGYYSNKVAWTNGELNELLGDPTRPELPFMYDHLHFPACGAIALDDDAATVPPGEPLAGGGDGR